jgi:hypothetical protein
VRAQNLFLILDDRVLIPEDASLIAQQLWQQILVPQDSLLVADDHALVGDDRVLLFDSRLRHYGLPGEVFVMTAICGYKNGDGRYLSAS